MTALSSSHLAAVRTALLMRVDSLMRYVRDMAKDHPMIDLTIAELNAAREALEIVRGMQ
jgi:hypothetical protein